MKSYVEQEELKPEDVALLDVATALVARVPGKLHDRWIRCHELARAVGRILELPVVDGAYGACDHSWLTVRSDLALDVYVPARLPQVQLCPFWLGAPATYRSGEPRTDIREDVVDELVTLMQDDSPEVEVLVYEDDDFDSALESGATPSPVPPASAPSAPPTAPAAAAESPIEVAVDPATHRVIEQVTKWIVEVTSKMDGRCVFRLETAEVVLKLVEFSDDVPVEARAMVLVLLARANLAEARRTRREYVVRLVDTDETCRFALENEPIGLTRDPIVTFIDPRKR